MGGGDVGCVLAVSQVSASLGGLVTAVAMSGRLLETGLVALSSHGGHHLFINRIPPRLPKEDVEKIILGQLRLQFVLQVSKCSVIPQNSLKNKGYGFITLDGTPTPSDLDVIANSLNNKLQVGCRTLGVRVCTDCHNALLADDASSTTSSPGSSPSEPGVCELPHDAHADAAVDVELVRTAPEKGVHVQPARRSEKQSFLLQSAAEELAKASSCGPAARRRKPTKLDDRCPASAGDANQQQQQPHLPTSTNPQPHNSGRCKPARAAACQAGADSSDFGKSASRITPDMPGNAGGVLPLRDQATQPDAPGRRANGHATSRHGTSTLARQSAHQPFLSATPPVSNPQHQPQPQAEQLAERLESVRKAGAGGSSSLLPTSPDSFPPELREDLEVSATKGAATSASACKASGADNSRGFTDAASVDSSASSVSVPASADDTRGGTAQIAGLCSLGACVPLAEASGCSRPGCVAVPVHDEAPQHGRQQQQQLQHPQQQHVQARGGDVHDAGGGNERSSGGSGSGPVSAPLPPPPPPPSFQRHSSPELVAAQLPPPPPVQQAQAGPQGECGGQSQPPRVAQQSNTRTGLHNGGGQVYARPAGMQAAQPPQPFRHHHIQQQRHLRQPMPGFKGADHAPPPASSCPPAGIPSRGCSSASAPPAARQPNQLHPPQHQQPPPQQQSHMQKQTKPKQHYPATSGNTASATGVHASIGARASSNGGNGGAAYGGCRRLSAQSSAPELEYGSPQPAPMAARVNSNGGRSASSSSGGGGSSGSGGAGWREYGGVGPGVRHPTQPPHSHCQSLPLPPSHYKHQHPQHRPQHHQQHQHQHQPQQRLFRHQSSPSGRPYMQAPMPARQPYHSQQHPSPGPRQQPLPLEYPPQHHRQQHHTVPHHPQPQTAHHPQRQMQQQQAHVVGAGRSSSGSSSTGSAFAPPPPPPALPPPSQPSSCMAASLPSSAVGVQLMMPTQGQRLVKPPAAAAAPAHGLVHGGWLAPCLDRECDDAGAHLCPPDAEGGLKPSLHAADMAPLGPHTTCPTSVAAVVAAAAAAPHPAFGAAAAAAVGDVEPLVLRRGSSDGSRSRWLDPILDPILDPELELSDSAELNPLHLEPMILQLLENEDDDDLVGSSQGGAGGGFFSRQQRPQQPGQYRGSHHAHRVGGARHPGMGPDCGDNAHDVTIGSLPQLSHDSGFSHPQHHYHLYQAHQHQLRLQQQQQSLYGSLPSRGPVPELASLHSPWVLSRSKSLSDDAAFAEEAVAAAAAAAAGGMGVVPLGARGVAAAAAAAWAGTSAGPSPVGAGMGPVRAVAGDAARGAVFGGCGGVGNSSSSSGFMTSHAVARLPITRAVGYEGGPLFAGARAGGVAGVGGGFCGGGGSFEPPSFLASSLPNPSLLAVMHRLNG